MKIKAGQAIFAILELAVDMVANQRAMNHLILQDMANGDETDYKELLTVLQEAEHTQRELLRARMLRYSEIDINDLLNGNFEV